MNIRGAVFITLFFTINVMGIIRYVFKWGDPASSPTYTLPPAEYFLAWNAMTGAILIILLVSFRKINVWLTLGYLLVVLSAMSAIIQSEVYLVVGAANSLILSGFVLIVLSANGQWIDIRSINKTIDFLGKLILVFLIFQIYQYEMDGVLPSHSHAGILIRYGSIYDDSLVLAVLMPMFLGYYLRRYSHTPALALVSLLGLLMVLHTGSLTGIIISVAYIFWCLRSKKVSILIFSALIAALLFVYYENIIYVLDFKSASIEDHIYGWSNLNKLEFSSFMGLRPQDYFVEPGYVSILLNFGLFVIAVLVGLMLYILTICIQTLKCKAVSRQNHMFFGAVEGLIISVLFANLNYPVVIYPPIFLILGIFSGLAIYIHSHESKSRLSSIPGVTLDTGRPQA